MTDFSAAVRDYVRQLIFTRGLSQNEFATELGRSQSSVSQLLTGHRHERDLDVWQEIAAYFDRSLSELIADVERLHLQRKAIEQAAVRQDPTPVGQAPTAERRMTPAVYDPQTLSLHPSQDVIENPGSPVDKAAVVMTPPPDPALTTPPHPTGDLDGDRRTFSSAAFTEFSNAFSFPYDPARSRLLLHQDIETFVQTAWPKRDRRKLQRLFESIATRIEQLTTPSSLREYPTRRAALEDAARTADVGHPQTPGAPRRSKAHPRPARKATPKSRQLRRRA